MSGTKEPHALQNFQLGDEIGKGASGKVFRALNFTNGETVAVKQIQLTNIPKAEVDDIMSEIHLLKNLNHPNIVKYTGFVKTKEFLYIILEYCENGSLHAICKRFGKFPENLVAVYISQVLEGLVYLHDQGVIHRDIKGANILTNKDGRVKLADFGVATAGGVSDSAVVGSPYWMAPEVIEQAGASTASDIWSLGCVVIELLEGKPPHHALEPMQALFRIVQDDSPPIPPGASDIVKDFLLACFQKDPNLRVSAKKLMRHGWMASARRQLDQKNGKESLRGEKPDLASHSERIQRVQEWNERLEKTSYAPVNNLSYIAPSPARRPNSGYGNQFPPLHPTGGITPTMSFADGLAGASKSTSPLILPSPPVKDPAALLRQMEESQEFSDNWDEDFEEEPLLSKLQANLPAAEPSKHRPLDEPERDHEDMKTIMPSRSPSLRGVPFAGSGGSSSASKSPRSIEDWSDMAPDADDLGLGEKVAQLSLANQRGILHPKDIKTFGLSASTSSPTTTSSPFVGAASYQDAPDPTIPRPSSPFSSLRITRPRSVSPTKLVESTRSVSGGSRGRADQAFLEKTDSDLRKYSEGAEDYEDIFGKAHEKHPSDSSSLKLNTRLSNRSWLGDDSDEVDPFAEIEEGYDDDADLETNLLRDKHARLSAKIETLINELQPQAADYVLKDTCDQLLNIIQEVPEMQAQLVSSHGMLAILEVLEAKPSRQVILRMLRIINIIIIQDANMLESFCLVGGIPVVISFTSKKYSSECRLEASIFISALCTASVQTLQMFISCRGLKVLVELLDEDYDQHRDLVISALGGIGSVFQLQSPTPRNDFCRMFIREGLEDPLSTALSNIIDDNDEGASEAKAQILAVFLLFCQVSQADSRVREALGKRRIIRRVLNTCSSLDSVLLVIVLKSIKHLSTNASTLETLQNANAIEVLAEVFGKHTTGPHSTEICNHVLQTLFNLCRLNKSRQEEAAQAGVIPHLKSIVQSKSPLKQFALPILLDMANAGKATRSLLWQNKGLYMYLDLIEDPYWQGSALEAILDWLQEETARVEDVLLEDKSSEQLLSCFVHAKQGSFETILDPFLKILRLSNPVTVSLSKPAFFRRLVERLNKPTKAVVRLNLLRITKTVIEVHPDRAALVERFGLWDIVERLARQDAAVLVRELAKEILPSLVPGSRSGVKTPSLAPAPIRAAMRRTSSESTLPQSSPSKALPLAPKLRPAVNAKAGARKPPRAGLSNIQWTEAANGALQRTPSKRVA